MVFLLCIHYIVTLTQKKIMIFIFDIHQTKFIDCSSENVVVIDLFVSTDKKLNSIIYLTLFNLTFQI